MDVEVIKDTGQLQSELSDDWKRLHAETPHANFFQSLEWFSARTRHPVEEDDGFRTYIVSEDGRPIGIIPMVIQNHATKVGVIRKLRFPDNGWCSFFGPLGPDPEKAIEAVSNFIWEKNEDRIDLAEFTTLPEYSPDTAPDVNRNSRGGQVIAECSHVANLYLNSSWDEYWESRRAQKNRRRNVERCERRLAELGEISYLRYRIENPGEDPRWDLFEECVDLARSSWQDGLVDGTTMHHDDVKEFVREAHQAAVDGGALDINLLYLDGRAIAYVYGYHYEGYLDLMRVGFDPDLKKLAPGNALWTRLIRDSIDRGDRVLDFGPSCLDYKKFWINKLETSHQITQFAPTSRGQGFRMARKLKEQTGRLFEEEDSNQRSKDMANQNKENSVALQN